MMGVYNNVFWHEKSIPANNFGLGWLVFVLWLMTTPFLGVGKIEIMKKSIYGMIGVYSNVFWHEKLIPANNFGLRWNVFVL